MEKSRVDSKFLVAADPGRNYLGVDSKNPMPTLDDIPLRPRKLALTKVKLLHAAVARLDRVSLDELAVRDLCEDAEISEASFFNYFPKKSDLLVYFVQLWTLDVAWHALRSEPRPATSFDAIARIFAVTGAQVAEHPGVMAEVLAAQARLTAPPPLAEITLAERLAAFPGRDGIETLEARGLESVLPELLAQAVKRRELPPRTDLRAAFLGLAAIFFGVPIALRRVDPRAVEAAYGQQLAIYWAGLQAPKSRKAGKR